jgi:hypothetical protein
MAIYSGYGDTTILHSGDALTVHRSQEPGVLILEYEVHGKKIRTGKAYDNRFISVVTRWSRVAISGGHSELSPIRFPQWLSADVS